MLNDAKTYTQTNKEEKNETRAFDRYSDTDKSEQKSYCVSDK
jgi:hypothetical protein